MYIREVIKKSANSQRVIYRLVDSYRTVNGPRQQTILTLKDLDLPKIKWKPLADAIEAKLKGQMVLYIEKDIDFLSDHYASQIQSKRLSEQRNVQLCMETDSPDYETVNIKSMKNKGSRTIGAEYVALSAYRDLGIDDFFKQQGFSDYQRGLAALSIIGRLVHPGSERSTRRWARYLSGLDQLLNTSFQNLSNNALYRIADAIFEHHDELEAHLQKRETDLFNLNETLVFYDLTNTYFEGRALSNPKAAFGHSKEKQSNCRLVTLGLIVDENGFAKRSSMMEGNQYEPDSLLEMIAKLENKTVTELKKTAGIKKDKTVVMDAGIAIDRNLELLRELGYDYICVARSKPISPREIKSHHLKKIKETKTNTIEVQLFRDETENILYCRSKLKGIKESSMLEKYKQKFEAELSQVRLALFKARGIKKYEKVIERIGRIKERNSAIARYYLINVERDQESDKAKDIVWEFNDFEKMEFSFSGSYFLKTSRLDLDEMALWKIYSTLSKVEAAFRSLKSELAFRPVHHNLEHRADSHLFIAILAYHLLNVIRMRLLEKDIHFSWNTIRELLSSHTTCITSMKAKDGRMILVQQAMEAEYIHNEIYKALNLKSKPFERVITKY